ncbi:MAG: 50S ribosomal protein L15 [Patescibacteria group bacterium]|nr:50S ribosomal protein L15 [Patescibacteria group bacterium]
MELNKLPKTTSKSNKRLGRGHGSGKVKTSGRGQKGQKAREKIKHQFEGGQLPLTKKLPFLRGKGRNYSLKAKNIVINVKQLNVLAKEASVDKQTLVKYRLLKEEQLDLPVKILGEGELTKVLTVKLPCSKGAKAKIEKAGGKVEQSR